MAVKLDFCLSPKKGRSRTHVRVAAAAFAGVVAAIGSSLFPPSSLIPLSRAATPTAYTEIALGADSSAPNSSLYRRLRQAWLSSGGEHNFGKLGLRPVAYGLFDRRHILFPYRFQPDGTFFQPEERVSALNHARFLNYGSLGFALLALSDGAAAKSLPLPLRSGVIVTRAPAIPLAESRTLASEGGTAASAAALQAELGRFTETPALAEIPARALARALAVLFSGGLRCTGLLDVADFDKSSCEAPAALGAIAAASPPATSAMEARADLIAAIAQALASQTTAPEDCLPMQRREPLRLELIGDAAQDFCLLHRATSDSRQPYSPPVSSLRCFRKNPGALLETQLDKVDFVLPTATQGVFLAYESSYRPARVTRIDLNQLSKDRDDAAPSTFLSAKAPSQSTVVPDIPLAVYRCPASRETWYYLKAEIAFGEQLVSPARDNGIVVTAQKAGVRIEQTPWIKLAAEMPRLDGFPSLACMLHPVLDVRCGIRVASTLGKSAVEMLSGHSALKLSPEERLTLARAGYQAAQHALYNLSRSLLARDLTALGNFMRKAEIELAEDLKHDGKPVPAPPPELPQIRLASDDPAALAHAQAKMRQYLALPDWLWDKL